MCGSCANESIRHADLLSAQIIFSTVYVSLAVVFSQQTEYFSAEPLIFAPG
jgi:hypothetical protein